ncbi:MAG: VOC family protein [Proteobacteria bacterium]|nr:VOC family protein [Pseudomonadota bacterium]
MFEIAGIDHIVLRTTKLSEMLDFYSNMLGCKVERETPEEVGLTQLRAGSALIDLVTVDSQLGRPGGGPPGATENNVDHFCLQLRPILQSEIESHLRSHGIQFGDFELRVGAQGLGSSVYIKDPEGNIVELRSQI